MGEIQSNINSLINTASIGIGLYAHSPMGQRMAELRNLKQREIAIKARQAAITASGENMPNDSAVTPGQQAAMDAVITQGRDVAKRRFELSPTTENLNRYNNSLTTGMTSQEMAAAQAQASTLAAQAQRQAQQELANKPKIFDQHGNDIYGRI